jgi:hypothetical protein
MQSSIQLLIAGLFELDCHARTHARTQLWAALFTISASRALESSLIFLAQITYLPPFSLFALVRLKEKANGPGQARVFKPAFERP